MDSFSRPSPADVQAHIRRGRAERSRVICGFFRRLAAAVRRRPLHPLAPPKAV